MATKRATDFHPTIQIDEEDEKQKKKKKDLLNLWITFSSVAVWVFIYFFIVLTEKARPQGVKLLDNFFGVERRAYWDIASFTAAFYVALVLFVFAIFSLIINSFRLKRKGDHIRISLILALFFSVVGMIWYVIYYYNNII